MRLKGKTAVVIGGADGIGKAIAKALAIEGARVVITYRSNKVNAQNTCREIHQINRKADFLYANFTDRLSVREFFKNLSLIIDKTDILVNNIGIIERKDFLSTDDIIFEQIYHVNVTIPLMLIQEIALYMRQSCTRGSIINISSIRGDCIVKNRVGYCCSKAALNMLTKCAAYELAEFQIRVNSIAPGLTEAGMNLETIINNPEEWQRKTSRIPLKRAGKPEDYNGIAVFLASEESSWLTGSIITVDGGNTLAHE